MKAIIGQKIGMTQILRDNGELVPITLISAEPVTVTQVKTSDKDGYQAVQLAAGQAKKLNKSLAGHVKATKVKPAIIKEFRIEDREEATVGASFDVSSFVEGDLVKVSGIAKGKGFAGVVKRHNFNTGPKSHGSRSYRRPGSIGSMYPQKVWRGKKMAGRMGGGQVTVKNQKIALVDAQQNVLGIAGTVPGPSGGWLTVEGQA